MQQHLEPRIPTPHLDALRPRVLRALHVRGWSCAPSQHDRKFRVRATRKAADRAAKEADLCVVAEFEEVGGAIQIDTQGNGWGLLEADLRREGVL